MKNSIKILKVLQLNFGPKSGWVSIALGHTGDREQKWDHRSLVFKAAFDW